MSWMILIAQAAGGTGAAGGTQPLPGSPAAPAGNPLMSLIIPVAAMILIFYFLLMRPQKKQEKARQAMLKDLKKGDRVVTIGGIHGVVANVRDKDVTLRVDDTGNIRIRFSLSAISRVIAKEEEEEDTKGDLGKS